ncbi:MAG: TolC family protein [Deltaproteobacteria bacterium]|nr:TolC family protein [Deltaproteobacteria bacterium]
MSFAMKDAVEHNLDLLVSEKFVEAGEEGVKVDRGPLLPQGQLQTGVVYQDPDRIFAGGQIAEWQASTVARGSQSLYSEQAWTRFKGRKLRQEGREYGYFTDVLDIMLGSGVSYVGVLRAEAEARIQRKNIQLTREYLELARVRLEIGVANASEAAHRADRPPRGRRRPHEASRRSDRQVHGRSLVLRATAGVHGSRGVTQLAGGTTGRGAKGCAATYQGRSRTRDLVAGVLRRRWHPARLLESRRRLRGAST